MKKIIAVFVVSSFFAGNISAQQIERLTFTDMRSDGTIIGTVTVNAVFMAYEQHRVSLEGNFKVTYASVNVNGKWSDWEFMQREPARVPTLRQYYDILLREYNRYPRRTLRLYHESGLQMVRIMTIRSGSSSPMWWSEDGRSYNILFESWAIIP